jgi:hypothetical protein
MIVENRIITNKKHLALHITLLRVISFPSHISALVRDSFEKRS